jgi:phage repressor protein C with HTH and peptisase S24 domain
VPVYGTALGSDLEVDGEGEVTAVERMTVVYEEQIDTFARPPGIAGNKHVYGLYVAGSSMSPRYDEGHPLYVDTKRPPVIGDDVIVQIIEHDADGNEMMKSALIKRLVRRTAVFVMLEQYNPPGVFKVRKDDVLRMHRVIPVSELLGI